MKKVPKHLKPLLEHKAEEINWETDKIVSYSQFSTWKQCPHKWKLQNVNKLNTKAEIRFNIQLADWIPNEVKQRLIQYQSNKINKDGELLITSQEHRTQGKNKEKNERCCR
jgi:hypothetical protein